MDALCLEFLCQFLCFLMQLQISPNTCIVEMVKGKDRCECRFGISFQRRDDMNHLEQLVGEWFEYNGYFVRRNVLVGRRAAGGYECELDVVAFNPRTKHLVHVEPSLDADSWAKRESRFKKKFKAGRDHIPELLYGNDVPMDFDQIVLLLFGSKANHNTIGGGRIMLVSELYQEITVGLRGKTVSSNAVSEQFPLLRTVQQCLQYEALLFQQQSDLSFPPLIPTNPPIS